MFHKYGYAFDIDGDEVHIDEEPMRYANAEAMLGLMLHGVQQGACSSISKGDLCILPHRMEDTMGEPVTDETQLLVQIPMTYKTFKEVCDGLQAHAITK